MILAAPIFAGEHSPSVAVRREGTRALGGLVVSHDAGNRKVIIAHPANWSELAAAEQAFLSAEENRQLYVAVTRAAEELVVSRLVIHPEKGEPYRADDTMWSALNASLDGHGQALTVDVGTTEGRGVLASSGEEIVAAGRAADGAARASCRALLDRRDAHPRPILARGGCDALRRQRPRARAR